VEVIWVGFETGVAWGIMEKHTPQNGHAIQFALSE
jgi:hypothetical protein